MRHQFYYLFILFFIIRFYKVLKQLSSCNATSLRDLPLLCCDESDVITVLFHVLYILFYTFCPIIITLTFRLLDLLLDFVLYPFEFVSR